MIIEFKDLTCGYGEKSVLSNMSFTVKTGEALCILGKNGIGKTTLIKTILRQLPIISGTILVDKKNIHDLSVHEMSQIFSYIPQSRDYSYNFDAIDVVLMGKANQLRVFSAPSESDKQHAIEIMQKLGIEEFVFKNYSMLSGGEQQMVLMARSMIQNASFILMDEPAANLDFYNQKKLVNLICSLKKSGIGIIMVSHNPDHGAICCENTLMIKGNGDYLFGETDSLITEDNLFDVFDVDMTVLLSETSTGRNLKTCSVNYLV